MCASANEESDSLVNNAPSHSKSRISLQTTTGSTMHAAWSMNSNMSASRGACLRREVPADHETQPGAAGTAAGTSVARTREL